MQLLIYDQKLCNFGLVARLPFMIKFQRAYMGTHIYELKLFQNMPKLKKLCY
jgi:hypothetical protein